MANYGRPSHHLAVLARRRPFWVESHYASQLYRHWWLGSGLGFLDLGLRRTRPKDGLHHLAPLGRYFSPCAGRLGELSWDRIAIAYDNRDILGRHFPLSITDAWRSLLIPPSVSLAKFPPEESFFRELAAKLTDEEISYRRRRRGSKLDQ